MDKIEKKNKKIFIPIAEPVLKGNELKYISNCIKTGWISSQGKYVIEFEKIFSRFCGSSYGVSTSNGTMALHLALKTLGIGLDDEVIVPTLTFVATANAVVYTGAKPIFVDSETSTWNMDPKKIEEKITNKTKAIIVVHLYGHPCDMDPILEIAKRRNLYVIEDCAEAHGAEYKGKKCGSMGDIGCFSFYANKVLTTGEGGMTITNNEKLAKKMQLQRNLAFGVPRFVHNEFGVNYRLSNIHAAIGTAQVENADFLVDARRSVGLKYLKELNGTKGLILPIEKDYAKNVYWMFGIVLDDSVMLSKEKLMEKLKERGIDTRSFFIPMNQQPVFTERKVLGSPDCLGNFPIANKVGQRGLYLPSSSNLKDEQIEFICKELKEILKEGESGSYQGNYVKYYDFIREDKEYENEINFVEEVFQKYSKLKIGSVLDLGCGTGNHCNALSRRGYNTFGIDNSKYMVKCAQEKNILNSQFRLGDISNFNLGEKFDSIISMFASMGYLNKNKEIEMAIKCIKDHLRKDGLLILDVWNGLAVMDEGPSSREKEIEKGNLKLKRTSYPELDPMNHLCKVKFKVEIEKNNQVIDKFEENHNVRYFFPQEIIKYLEDGGFEVLEICPSYNLGKKITEKDWWIQIIARNNDYIKIIN